MSPTVLEKLIAIAAAAVVFWLAMHVVPIAREALKQDVDRTLAGEDVDERNAHDHERTR